MSDRELLEMAARAAGIEIPDGIFWSPLTEDGDAFRLAVRLKIIVTFAYGSSEMVSAGQRGGPFAHEELPIGVFVDKKERAATRRAIVRAAAEIGKNMEGAP